MSLPEIVSRAVRALDAKKGEDLVVLDVARLTVIADYFVIASASNTTQVQALAEEVEQKLTESGFTPLRVEGLASANWVLMDYGSVLIHIFYAPSRQFYNLERLWADAARMDTAQLLEES